MLHRKQAAALPGSGIWTVRSLSNTNVLKRNVFPRSLHCSHSTMSQSWRLREKANLLEMPLSLFCFSFLHSVFIKLQFTYNIKFFSGVQYSVSIFLEIIIHVKNLPAMQELWEMGIQSLNWEDSLEEGMATHFSILAWRTPWTGEPGKLQSMRSQRVRHH